MKERSELTEKLRILLASIDNLTVIIDGPKLEAARAPYSQRDAARAALGCRNGGDDLRRYFSRWENDHNNPKWRNLVRVCDYLETDPFSLMVDPEQIERIRGFLGRVELLVEQIRSLEAQFD